MEIFTYYRTAFNTSWWFLFSFYSCLVLLFCPWDPFRLRVVILNHQFKSVPQTNRTLTIFLGSFVDKTLIFDNWSQFYFTFRRIMVVINWTCFAIASKVRTSIMIYTWTNLFHIIESICLLRNCILTKGIAMRKLFLNIEISLIRFIVQPILLHFFLRIC